MAELADALDLGAVTSVEDVSVRCSKFAKLRLSRLLQFTFASVFNICFLGNFPISSHYGSVMKSSVSFNEPLDFALVFLSF